MRQRHEPALRQALVEAARRCPNIVATLAKPFTPGQLVEAVRGAESFIAS